MYDDGTIYLYQCIIVIIGRAPKSEADGFSFFFPYILP